MCKSLSCHSKIIYPHVIRAFFCVSMGCMTVDTNCVSSSRLHLQFKIHLLWKKLVICHLCDACRCDDFTWKSSVWNVWTVWTCARVGVSLNIRTAFSVRLVADWLNIMPNAQRIVSVTITVFYSESRSAVLISYVLIIMITYSLVKKYGDGGGGHWLVWMQWRPAGWSVCLLLLIFPCIIKSRISLLAPAHSDGLAKRAVKWLWWCGGYSLVKKLHPFYFLKSEVRNKTILMILVQRILWNFGSILCANIIKIFLIIIIIIINRILRKFHTNRL